MNRAFTMLEIVLVLIVIAILAGVASSAYRTDKTEIAAVQVSEAIQYAQHLALSQHKFTPKDADFSGSTEQIGRYWKEFWQVQFSNGSVAVYSDKNRNGKPDAGEYAKKPLEKDDYITAIEADVRFKDGCEGTQQILFDEKGRPLLHAGTTSAYTHALRTRCKIEIVTEDGQAVFYLEPETGYLFQ